MLVFLQPCTPILVLTGITGFSYSFTPQNITVQSQLKHQFIFVFIYFIAIYVKNVYCCNALLIM